MRILHTWQLSKIEARNGSTVDSELDCLWNVMAQAQKPDFLFRRNGRVHLEGVHLNRRGASVHSTTGSRGVRISGSNGSNAGYTMFQGSVMRTGYPLHSPVSLSLPLPCVTVCHHISTGLYYQLSFRVKSKCHSQPVTTNFSDSLFG